ncbi:cyclic phosphodiesterase-like [Olea europaea subsp. europaea]|uniref:Cyclic phosphodiesterase-like n=1 Tax=Olea europaea subsp. europaea TaxID=158383 RepID=A0A8S0V9F2_OLEEU|nr:cyclic phosphodiesterase-like [Olea europaea subsp. europaea]
MDSSTTSSVHINEVGKDEMKKDVYSVWALPPEDVRPRLKKLMNDLRSEFGGPEFEPHVTVVGTISLTEREARDMFNKACEGLKAYNANVERVSTGTYFYQCVFLLLQPTPEVMEASTHCTSHFGYKTSTPYMPHLSLLYGDLTDEEKMKAQEKANVLDKDIRNLSFQISLFALYKVDTKDKTCKSWEKVAECKLNPN